MSEYVLALVIQVVAGASLFWSSFCRLSLTDDTTLPEIRYVVWFQSVTALFVIFAPFLPIVESDFKWAPLTTPLWVWVMLVVSAASVQIVTAVHWGSGVPRPYLRPEYRPKRRASDNADSTLPA